MCRLAPVEEGKRHLPPFLNRRRWVKNPMPAEWHIGYGDRLRFVLRPMGFKHTGLFPEQAANWDWFSALIRRAREAEPERQVRVLNLFAYTGGATVAAAAAGAAVVRGCLQGNDCTGEGKRPPLRAFRGTHPLYCGRLQ